MWRLVDENRMLPGAVESANKPRVDPTPRTQGIDNFDFFISERAAITEKVKAGVRPEFFNVFNRKQFSPPHTQPGAAQFGQVTAQYHQPRLVQFGLRLSF